jgi:hypothetical protein
MKDKLYCPVSPNKVDENVTRIAAFVMTAFFLTGIILKSYILVLLVAVDFAIRAFTDGKFSFIRTISKSAAGLLKLKSKPIDAAPKKFAAGLGFAMAALTGILLYSGDFTASYLVGAILILCAFLEGAFAICLGCHVYSFIVVPFYKYQNKGQEYKHNTIAE